MPGIRRWSITYTCIWVGLLAVCFLPDLLLVAEGVQHAKDCKPTPRDAMGPFYEPNAPFRTTVGEGYILRGVVRSTAQCRALAGAVFEFWLTGSDGRYGDAYRARLRADESGQYQFESNKPSRYGGRPPHIHIRVTAAGHRTLVTQHYPARGQNTQTFDLVLRPAR